MKKLFVLILAVGLGSLIASLFLFALNYSVEIFQNYWNYLIWLLPLAGLGLAWFIRLPYFHNCEVDHSPRLAPFTFISSCWSHLFGVSMGRESAALYVGNSVTETIRRLFKLEEHDRNHFMTAGTSAAFSAAMGLPISSILFSLEYRKKWDLVSFVYASLASFVGLAVTSLLHTPHWQPKHIFELQFTEINWIGFSLVSFLVVLISYFIFFTEEKFKKKLQAISVSKKLVISGLIITITTLALGSSKYNNYGVPLLDSSFLSPSLMHDFILKLIFTEVSLLGLWKGGAFVPFMSLGAMLGSALSGFFTISTTMTGASLSVFALINLKFKIPITSIFLTGELFGWKTGLLSAPIHILLGLGQKSSRKHLS